MIGGLGSEGGPEEAVGNEYWWVPGLTGLVRHTALCWRPVVVSWRTGRSLGNGLFARRCSRRLPGQRRMGIRTLWLAQDWLKPAAFRRQPTASATGRRLGPTLGGAYVLHYERRYLRDLGLKDPADRGLGRLARRQQREQAAELRPAVSTSRGLVPDRCA